MNKFKETEIKPCNTCGSDEHIFQCSDKHGLLYGYGIGCSNIKCCDSRLFIGYGLTEGGARKRAARKWNNKNKDYPLFT